MPWQCPYCATGNNEGSPACSLCRARHHADDERKERDRPRAKTWQRHVNEPVAVSVGRPGYINEEGEFPVGYVEDTVWDDAPPHVVPGPTQDFLRNTPKRRKVQFQEEICVTYLTPVEDYDTQLASPPRCLSDASAPTPTALTPDSQKITGPHCFMLSQPLCTPEESGSFSCPKESDSSSTPLLSQASSVSPFMSLELVEALLNPNKDPPSPQFPFFDTVGCGLK